MKCHCCSGNCRKSGSYRNRNRVVQRFFCDRCGKSFSEEQPLDGLRVDFDKACQVVHMLCESMGIRAIQQLTGLHQETILNILEAAGPKAARFLDAKIRNLHVTHVQTDEIASYIGCHQHKARPGELHGAFYTFLSVDKDSKLIINHRTDRRNATVAWEFMKDLHDRIAGRFQLCTDGWTAYSQKNGAVHSVFGNSVDYATEIKRYASVRPKLSHLLFHLDRFTPLRVESVIKRARIGQPDMDMATTSHCERTNLTIRQFLKRFNRLTLGYSKKFSNHNNAFALFVFYFNFVKIHGAHGKTPAQMAGLIDKPMTFKELLQSTI